RSGATAIYHQLPPAYVPTMRLEVGRSVAQPGSALASGARGRGFESPRSDQQNQQLTNVETLGGPSVRPKLGRGASSGTWKAERAHLMPRPSRFLRTVKAQRPGALIGCGWSAHFLALVALSEPPTRQAGVPQLRNSNARLGTANHGIGSILACSNVGGT